MMKGWFGRLLKACVISAVLTLGLFVVAKLNLFNLEVRGEEVSDDLSQRLGLESYEARIPKGEPRKGQDLIRVITIDDYGVESLADVGWPGWPPGYMNLGMMIEDLTYIMGRVPRQAVFFDFLISGRNIMSDDEARGADYLVQAVAGLTGAKAAEGRPGWGDIEACQADPLLKLACMVVFEATPVIFATTDEVRTQVRARDMRADLSKVALLTPVFMNERNYDLIREKDGRIDLYPASALYLAYCLHGLTAGQDLCGLEAVKQAYALATGLKQGQSLADVPRPAQGLLAQWQSRPIATVWSSEAAPDQDRLLSAVSGGDYSPASRGSRRG